MADTVEKFLKELDGILHLEDTAAAKEQFASLSRRILKSAKCKDNRRIHDQFFAVAEHLQMEWHVDHKIPQTIAHTMPPPHMGFVADGAGFAQAVSVQQFVSSRICGND